MFLKQNPIVDIISEINMNRFHGAYIARFFLLSLSSLFSGILMTANGQCTPPGPTSPPVSPSITATPGPDHLEFRYTVSNFDPTANTEVWISNDLGANYYYWANASPSSPSGGRINMGSHWTFYLFARSVNSCGSTDSGVALVTTFDVPNPWVQAYAGPNPNAITVLSHYIGPPNHAYGVELHGVFPNGLDQNWFTFIDQGPQTRNVGMPGVYRFYATTQINPWEFRTSPNIYVALAADQDYGNPSCNSSRGRPVNVINGNMYIGETDYVLPGLDENITVSRSYNSLSGLSGLFGEGWTSEFDENIVVLTDLAIRLQMPDGRGAYLGRPNATSVYESATTDLQARAIKNSDNTFILTFKDGRIHKFGSDGRLLWRQDRNGNQTTLNYHATTGSLTGITDAVGRTLSIELNGNGNITKIYDSMSTIATYEYIPSTNRLSSIAYHDDSRHDFEYTATPVNGRYLLKTVRDALGNVLETHEYNSNGRATTSEVANGVEKYTFDYTNPAMTVVTDAAGVITKFYFSAGSGLNVVSKVEGVCGCGGSGNESTQYFYDDRLNLVKKTDALNRETVYTYDSDRNVTAVTDFLGTQSFTYNSLGEVLTATDRMGGVTANTYSSTGNLLTTRDPLNNTTTFTYNSFGQPATLKDALDRVTTFTWDSQGRMTKVKDANNKETNFAYDARARITGVTNAKAETTSFSYDLNNRLSKITYPDTTFTSVTYDLAGRRTAVTDPLGHATTYGYDGAYRMISVTDALNQSTSFVYDLMSNMVSQTDALGNLTGFEYDDFNRLKQVKYPFPVAGGTRLEENFTYDLVGRPKTHIDTAGRATTYVYDDPNKKISITDPMSQVTQFEYNARSQVTKVKDALNQEYLFTFDPLGRTLTETRAGTTMSFEYDAVGNRKKRTDHAGRISQYTYDNLNRLTKIDYGTNPSEGGTSKQYAYDELSRLVSAINEAGTVAFTYDNRNRLKTETDVFGHVVEYGYDAANRRTLLKLDGSNLATYAFDNADRLTGITNSSDGTTTSFAYDIADRLTSRAYPNGVTTTYDYDGMSRLMRLKDVNAASTLFDRQYSYNSANQISQIVEPSSSRLFGYDNVNRLILVTGGSTESYVFDVVGNRTASHLSSSYSYSPFNKLTATQTATYNFDPNGNTVAKAEGSNFWRYGFDHENQVTSVANRRQTVRYFYDALGRRVRRHIKGSKENTKFTYEGEDVLLDDDVVTGATKYLNGPGIDNKLRQTNGSTTSYFLADHLGSTNGLTNASGAVTASNSYDSFGNPSNLTFPTRYQFTGREFDNFSGLQYSRARFYDPNIGRFISEDPIGFGGGDVNLYGYVLNRPNRFRDPTGLITPAELADALDEGLDATASSCECDVPIGFVGIPPYSTFTAFDIARGITNMLRVGQGTGRALYGPDDNAFGRAAGVAMDIQRGSDIFATLIAPFASSGVAVPKGPPNPFGKLGSPLHQSEVQRVGADIAARGLTPRYEYHVPTPGGSKCRRFVDVAALDSFGKPVEFHQIGRVTGKGKIPVSRERQAIDDLINAMSGVPVRFHSF